jgi:amino acid adenylation domain-containing protein
LSNNEVTQYIQFSEWQNQILEDEDLEAKEFWQQHSLPDTEIKLPFELKKIDDSLPFAIDSINLQIEQELCNAIANISDTKNVSISTFFLSIWLILLWRLTNQKSLVIGTAYDGRQYEELANAIGLFAKYLPVNVPLQQNYCFSDVLQQVEKVTQQVSEWQDYFNAEEGDKSKQLLYEFGFSFNTQPKSYVSGDVTFSILEQYVCIERCKINLSCTQRSANFEYDTNLFDRQSIQLIAEYYQALIASAIAYPEISISQLQILTSNHQKQLLAFNNNEIEFPKYGCIQQLFEMQVERTPDNTAVVCNQQQLTYRELNDKANRLAGYLQELGVKPEVIVGIYAERSLDTIIAILAILKAGGAYLPLDPNYPQERLAFMLEDSKVSILLTQQHLQKSLPQNKAKIICLDTDWRQIVQFPLSPPAPPVSPAYIIYTSGSTGTPKGVAVEHQQLLNYIQAVSISLDIPPSPSWALVSTFAADLGNTAIFSALSAGGCLHILSNDTIADPEAIKNYCQKHPIDCLKIVPSHLKALLTASEPAPILPRQRLVLGGESLDWELVDQIHRLAPQCSIYNHYGPTEATVGVLTYRVEADISTETVPLGKAIANTQVYILDKHLHSAPIGVPGEIYIGGKGVVCGYLNRPDLTQERFIANPIENCCTSPRLYKTGDLGRYLPDGNIEFLGRIDEQVKIRGYRVELGEITAAKVETSAQLGLGGISKLMLTA